MTTTAKAQSPVAVVEEVKGKVVGVEFMDYVTPGTVIKLGPKGSIVLGYLKSCWRETITGGTVVVGVEQSLVHLAEIEQHNAHRTEEREVLYPWHPWFGRVVFVHETVNKGGVLVLRCSQSSEEGARCLETPEWIFDRATCCGMVRGDSPRVNRAALYRLKALISGGFVGSSGGVIEARSYSLSPEGEADAPSGSRSCPAARSVPSSQSESGLVATPGGNARRGSAPDGAPTTRTKEPGEYLSAPRGYSAFLRRNRHIRTESLSWPSPFPGKRDFGPRDKPPKWPRDFR